MIILCLRVLAALSEVWNEMHAPQQISASATCLVHTVTPCLLSHFVNRKTWWRARRVKLLVKMYTDGAGTATIIFPAAMQTNDVRFWDGDPTKQSFISVVGLSTPRGSRARSRPASAPARAAYTSGFNSPRKHHDNDLDATEPSDIDEVNGGQTCLGSSRQHFETSKRNITSHQGEQSVEVGRLRVLENRLNELMRENACMRDAMLNKVDERRLERLAQAQRRNHELIATLQTAKEGAEGKARRSQERVRALQVLRNRVLHTYLSGLG